jgi:hypothetical protein
MRHGSANCNVVRRRIALLILLRIQIEQFTTEEQLVSFLQQIPKENLDIVSKNYSLEYSNDIAITIRRLAHHMISIQQNGTILASNRISNLKAHYPGMQLSEIIPLKLQEMYIIGLSLNQTTDNIVTNIRNYVFTELYENQPTIIKDQLKEGFLRFINIITSRDIVRENIPIATAPLLSTIIKSTESYESDKEQDCCICFECKPHNKFVKTNCNHEFCYSCIESHLISDATHRCPMCRTTVATLTYSSGEPTVPPDAPSLTE